MGVLFIVLFLIPRSWQSWPITKKVGITGDYSDPNNPHHPKRQEQDLSAPTATDPPPAPQHRLSLKSTWQTLRNNFLDTQGWASLGHTKDKNRITQKEWDSPRSEICRSPKYLATKRISANQSIIKVPECHQQTTPPGEGSQLICIPLEPKRVSWKGAKVSHEDVSITLQ